MIRINRRNLLVGKEDTGKSGPHPLWASVFSMKTVENYAA